MKKATQLSPGFTLVEILISLVVIQFCFLAVLTVLSSSHRSGQMAEKQTLAVFLADTKLEQLRYLTPSGMPENTPVRDYFDRDGTEANPDNHYFVRSVVLKRQTPSQFTNEVTVEVEWPGGKPVSYTSVIPSS
ncbi:MAG: type II secretion system GspH family protein [Deltaproteobacteria bacterium]|nr:type II secretion system GspH family protein [Deltaproteobacteria bacterium]